MKILKGSIIIYRLFDISWWLDLEKVEKRVDGAQRLRIERKRFSRAFHFANPPVTVNMGSISWEYDGKSFDIQRYAKLYDYGALSVITEVPVTEMQFEKFEELAAELADRSPFDSEAFAIRDHITQTFRDAMKGSGAEGIYEDYTLYYLKSTEPTISASGMPSVEFERLLLSEPPGATPSSSTRRDLFANTFSYLENDLAVINWDNALVLDPTGSMDIPDLLEFANSQLLELRVYDSQLTREMDTIYDHMSVREKPSVWKMRKYRDLAAKTMVTITELTEITERIDNSLKVTDDVYYAKVYSATLDLFKVRSWAANIKQKIEIATRTYDMLNKETATKRSEWLEIIIILLIAVEIVFFVYLELKP